MGLMNFIWFPSSEGSPPVGYDVHVTNTWGQVVTEVYVEDAAFSYEFEGTYKLSVRSVDYIGRKSDWSEWTGWELSPGMGGMWLQIGQIVGVPQIVFVAASAAVFHDTWEDPH